MTPLNQNSGGSYTTGVALLLFIDHRDNLSILSKILKLTSEYRMYQLEIQFDEVGHKWGMYGINDGSSGDWDNRAAACHCNFTFFLES